MDIKLFFLQKPIIKRHATNISLQNLYLEFKHFMNVNIKFMNSLLVLIRAPSNRNHPRRKTQTFRNAKSSLTVEIICKYFKLN